MSEDKGVLDELKEQGSENEDLPPMPDAEAEEQAEEYTPEDILFTDEDKGDKSGDASRKTEPEDKKETEAKQPEFYKSQQEVDAAFAKRIAAERRKWEQERDVDRKLARMYRELHNLDGSPEEQLKKAEEAFISAIAERENISPSLARRLYLNDYGRSEDTAQTAEGSGGVPIDRAYALAMEEAEFKKEHPDFDLVEEVKNNEVFAALIRAGWTIAKAYERSNPAKYEQEAEKRVVENIAKRNAKPAPITARKPAAPVFDISRASDEQIEKIAAAVKAGKRVVL